MKMGRGEGGMSCAHNPNRFSFIENAIKQDGLWKKNIVARS